MAAEPRLSDLARRLAESGPYTPDRAFCQFCCQREEREHFTDCPWLALPRLVAVAKYPKGPYA